MKVLIIVMLALVGCTEDNAFNKVHSYYCSYQSQEKRANFILICIKNGNPMSDEEPEDLVRECDRTAKSTYCFYGDQFQAKKHYDRLDETLQEEL